MNSTYPKIQGRYATQDGFCEIDCVDAIAATRFFASICLTTDLKPFESILPKHLQQKTMQYWFELLSAENAVIAVLSSTDLAHFKQIIPDVLRQKTTRQWAVLLMITGISFNAVVAEPEALLQAS